MSTAAQFEKDNRKYVSLFNKGELPLPPSREVAVVVCMDARIDPAKALNLEEGQAHVIRNAGGRASDALRSVIISQRLLGTRELVVIHHTDCGMLTFTDDQLRQKLKEETGLLVDDIAFLSFSDLKQSVREDVEYFQKNPLVLDVPVTGFIYDVHSGKIEKVE
ncbi:uncharacterized protein PRCAT00005062001 [Priceomyces carsonii]|uniref:uncharacterized protein n=1 Tax=Priceomyces carsonii TaxID=28549 RepID=UPI002ED871C9|nr:unnamed protein product [Priceomyces carsonii]